MSDADHWKDRPNCMICRTCMWYIFKAPNVPVTEESPLIGRCRRHAPTMFGYPVIFDRDWCGDHKLDENKIA